MAESITLYENYFGGSEKTFQLAYFDADSHPKNVVRTGTATLPNDQGEAKFIWLGMGFGTGTPENVQDKTPTDDSNRIIGPWSMAEATRSWGEMTQVTRNFMGCNEGWLQVPIGQKPNDWENGWRTKYYIESHVNPTHMGGSSQIFFMHQPSSTWDANTQYYYTLDHLKKPTVAYVTKKTKLSFSYCQWFSTYGSQDGTNYGTVPFRVFNNSNMSGLDTVLWNIPDINGSTIITNSNDFNALINIRYGLPSPYGQNTYACTTHYCQMIKVKYNNEIYIGWMEIDYVNNNDQPDIDHPRWCDIVAISANAWDNDDPEPEPGWQGPSSYPSGGDGSFTGENGGSTFVDTGTNGSFGSMNIGPMRTFAISNSELGTLMSGIAVVTDPLGDSRQMEVALANITEGIIDCYALPFKIPDSQLGTSTTLSVLGTTTTATGKPVISDQFSSAQDNGFSTCHVGAYFGTFLDYEPHTTAYISLPFIGQFQIPVEDIIGCDLELKYLQDNHTGDLIATLQAKPTSESPRNGSPKKIVGQWGGNGKYTISLSRSSKNWDKIGQVFGSVATFIGSGAASAVTGNPLPLLGGISSAIIGLGKSSQMPSKKGWTSGSFSGNTGWLSYRIPFIRIKRSPYYYDNAYNSKGYMCDIFMPLSGCSGFTKVSNFPIDEIQATDDEKTELLHILTSGFYVNDYTV